jgi:hypothetical protein
MARKLKIIWILGTSDIGVLPDIGVSDVGYLQILEFRYPISGTPISVSSRHQSTVTPILIPISRRSDIGYQNSDVGYQNSDIGHTISDVRYNIRYNIGGPDIGVW